MDSNINTAIKSSTAKTVGVNDEISLAPKAKLRMRLEMPWVILLAMLVGTFVAAYKSEQAADAAASKRFYETAQSAYVDLQHELEATQDLLESTSAFVSMMPNAGIDANSWSNFFNARSARSTKLDHGDTADSRHGLIRVDHIPSSRVLTGSELTAATTPRLSSLFGPNSGAIAAQTNLENIPAVALAIAEASKRSGVVLTVPLNLAPAAGGKIVAMVLAANAQNSDEKISADKTPANRKSNVALSAVDAPPLSTVRVPGSIVGLINLSEILTKTGRAEGNRIGAVLVDETSKPNAAEPLRKPQFSLVIGGRSPQQPLKILVTSTPSFEDELKDSSPRIILMVGIIGAVLLAGFIWLLSRLRQQAESLSESMTARLRDQMKLNEDIIEFNPSPIYRKNVEGQFIAVNRAWEQLFGYRRKDVFGKVNRDIQQVEQVTGSDAADQKLYEIEGGYDVTERVFTNAEGRQLETMVAKRLIRRADGTVDGLIGTITDLSPVRRLEREIAAQREQLDLVISASQQGIWDVELRPGGSTYFSSAFREMLGYASGGFPAPYLWEANIHPDDQALFAKEQIRHFKGETPFFDIEARALRRDGSYLWVRTRAVARREQDGRAARFVGSIVNVSDRKDAERMLIESSSRIAEAAKAKESFLATMSHEIRTPLNGVLGMAALLADTPLNEEQHDYIRLIRASGDTLLSLINDVLDFSKIEAGHMSLESVPVELIALIEETFEIVAEKAREKRIALIYDVRDDVPFYILGDATRLRQILLNLLSNALKFTESGEIKLTVTAQRNQAGRLRLEGRVQDTGVGISAEQIAKLFTPFTQANASTTRKYGGTGLGLAIVKRLTAAMNGNVRVESVLSEGATFIFNIETQLARGPLRPYMQREVFDFLGKKILIVDSIASRRKIRQTHYARWGFDAVSACPDDAAATLRAMPGLDIVITDFVQPSVEANEFQAALAANDKLRLVQRAKPIVSLLLSSISRTDLARQNCLPAVRHDFFLVRPVSITKLFDALMRAVLDEHSNDKSLRPYLASEKTTDGRDASAVHAHSQSQSVRAAVAAADNTNGADSTDTKKSVLATLPTLRPGEAALNQASSPATEAAAKRVKPTTTRSYNVLVAEDNEVNQQVIGGMLRNLGHRYTMVGDGRAAVNAAKLHHFDVILMDIQMPILDGTAATLEIRTYFADAEMLNKGACPPIVAMTAHALAGDKEGYLANGMDDYISKPIRSAEVAAVLKRTAGQSTPAENEASDAVAIMRVETSIESSAALLPEPENVTPATGSGTIPAATSGSNTNPIDAPISAEPVLDGSVTKTVLFARSDLATRIDQLPLLDIEQLEDLRYLPAAPGGTVGASAGGSDPSDPVGGLIRLFQTKACERMDKIEACLADREWKALSEVAHSLRGSSASMGFPRVAALCKDLELASSQLAKIDIGGDAGNSTRNNTTSGTKLATQSELDEIFELTRYYYNQADIALREWLIKTAPLPPK